MENGFMDSRTPIQEKKQVDDSIHLFNAEETLANTPYILEKEAPAVRTSTIMEAVEPNDMAELFVEEPLTAEELAFIAQDLQSLDLQSLDQKDELVRRGTETNTDQNVNETQKEEA